MSNLKELKDSLEELNTKIIESIAEPDDGKPYAGEFSCRLYDPGQFDSFARKNCYKKHNNKCIDFIFGIKAGKSKVQAMRYKKKTWDKSSAHSHCSSHDGSFEA